MGYPVMNSRKMLTGGAIIALGAIATVGHSASPPASAQVAPSPGATAAPIAGVTIQGFEIGDKLKLMFYERLTDVEATKWGKDTNGFQQRAELSGEFTVQDDGTISFPLLGSFQVTDKNSQYLQSTLAETFEKLTGRKGFVTILSIERPPVFVLGPVKSPGSFKYMAGMTVLHAVAMAGGFGSGIEQTGAEPFQKIEAVSQTLKRIGSAEAIAELFARRDALVAERDHVPAAPSDRLIKLVGEATAIRMIAAEVNRRASIVEARKSRLASVTDQVAAAQQELDLLSNRLGPIEGLIALRQKRANAMNQFLASGTINNNYAIQAQAELTDAQQRWQDAVNQVTQAKLRLSQVQSQKTTIDADARTELETAINQIDHDIAANGREFDTSSGILTALKVSAPGILGQPAPPTITYEVIRQTLNGPVSILAEPITVLKPGDLVRVVAASSAAPASAPGAFPDPNAIIHAGEPLPQPIAAK
jgi:exopolysaccharide production protein ExoF